MSKEKQGSNTKTTSEAFPCEEETLVALVERSPVATVISKGLQQEIVYLNPKFIKNFGYTIEDMPTVEEWWMLAYPDDGYREQIKNES